MPENVKRKASPFYFVNVFVSRRAALAFRLCKVLLVYLKFLVLVKRILVIILVSYTQLGALQVHS